MRQPIEMPGVVLTMISKGVTWGPSLPGINLAGGGGRGAGVQVSSEFGAALRLLERNVSVALTASSNAGSARHVLQET